MDNTVQLAIIVAMSSVFTGALTTFGAIILRRMDKRAASEQRQEEAELKRLEKAEDRRREDEVAARLLAQQAIAAAKAAEAAALAKEVSVKIDGMLADRDKANIKVGEMNEAIRGADRAAQLAEGQRQGREDERARLAIPSDVPIKVADQETQDATKRAADALERTAAAAEAAGKTGQ